MIVRPTEPFVALSAETCKFIEDNLDMRRLRLRVRGFNPRVAQELVDLRELALGYDPPLAEAEAAAPEVARGLRQWLSTTDVAELAMVSDSAVRLACRTGRITDAENRDGKWRISRQAAQDYKAARAA